MNIKGNRERFYWLLSSFADRVRANPDKPNAEIVNGFLDGEIAMEDGWKEYAKAVDEVDRKNKRLLYAIKRVKGKTYFKRLMQLINECEGIRECFLGEMVREPNGEFVKEPLGRQISGYWVDQRTVGTEGDSYEGTICVEIKPNKYFKFHYSM